MRSGGRLLAGRVVVPADDRTGGRRCIGDFYCFFCRNAYREFLTFELSYSADLVRVRKRCIPHIIAEVLHLNLNLTLERSGYDNFLVYHMGPHFSSLAATEARSSHATWAARRGFKEELYDQP